MVSLFPLLVEGKRQLSKSIKRFRTYETVNPFTEESICSIPSGCKDDVDKAVEAAINAFENGEWTKMSARERGKRLFKLADLMEQHKVSHRRRK